MPRGDRVGHPETQRLGVTGSLALARCLETTSKPRAEWGRAFLEALAGDAVRHRATSFESVEQAMEHRPAEPARETDEIASEVQAELVGACYDKHYRGWVDTPLPALSGQTPREAAGSKAGRPRVVALVKDMESLGLDRPG